MINLFKKFKSNTPELDLQIEIDRYAIQKHVQKLLYEPPSKELLLKSDLITSNKTLNQTSEVGLSDSTTKKYSLKSIELPLNKIHEQSLSPIQNISTQSRAQSHSNKTIDSSRSVIKRKIKFIFKTNF